jgi:two-component system response regulator
MGEKFILLVEDNPNDVTLTQMAFRKCKISNKLAAVSDGEEALDFLFSRGKYAYRDHNEEPALIMLDLNLPCIGGLQVLQQIRVSKRTSSIPVVILTSSVEDADRDESFHLGANDFFIKPVDFNEFVEVVGQLISKWLGLNEFSPIKPD